MPTPSALLSVAMGIPVGTPFRGRPMEVWLDARTRLVEEVAPFFDRVLLSGDAVGADTPAGTLCAKPGPDGRCRLVSAGSDELRGASIMVDTPEEQREALALVGSVEWLHIESQGVSGAMPMITAENVISAIEGTPTRLAMSVTNAADVPGLAFALSLGCDALVCPADALCEGGAPFVEALLIAKAQRAELMSDGSEEGCGSGGGSTAATKPEVRLRTAVVTRVTDGGVADRVALDFTRLLGHDEGCLVGSSAKALAFVHAETVASGFVPPRPFRCNAGPVHSYVLMADGSTKYLSEVTPGDAILIARSAEGGDAVASTQAVVGRCKIEPRPTICIEYADADAAEGDGDGYCAGQVFLQQAETVRLATPTHEGLPVTRVAASAEVLVRFSSMGTHVGREIRARVEER